MNNYMSLLALANSLGGVPTRPDRGRVNGNRSFLGAQKSIIKSSKNRAWFLNHFMSILVPIWAPILDLFGIQIAPILIQKDLQTFFVSKMLIFTKCFKNQWFLMIFHSKMDPKTTQDEAKTDPRRSQIPSFSIMTQKTPKRFQEAPKRPPRGPQEAPKWP